MILSRYPRLIQLKSTEPIKVYKGTVSLPLAGTVEEKRFTAGSTVVITNADSGSETPTTPISTRGSFIEEVSNSTQKNETSTSTTQSTSDSPTSSEQESDAEATRKLAEEAKRKVFLNQVYRNLESSFPPELQTIVTENPELLDQAWKTFLDRLAEYGYTPPD